MPASVPVAVRLVRLHFRHCHHGDETTEEEEHREEQPEATGEGQEVPFRGEVVTPGGGNEVAVEGGCDDDEALEPHPDVHQDADDHHRPEVRANLLEPE